MDNALSIYPTPPADQPISLKDDGVVKAVDPAVAAVRASKAEYGLSELVQKRYEDYYGPIAQGYEKHLRKEVSGDLGVQQSNALFNQLSSITDASKIQSLLQSNKPVDPESVFEQNFSRKFINSGYYVEPGTSSWVGDALIGIPDQVEKTRKMGQDWLTRIEYSKKREQDIAQTLHDQSYIGWGLDLLKTLDPTYVTRKLTGNVPGVSPFTSLLGKNLADQAALLRAAPTFEEFKAQYDAILNKLEHDNPQMAAAFAHAVSLMSDNEITLSNVFQGLDLATIGGMGAAGVSLIKKAALYNQTLNYTKNLVAGARAAETQPVKVSAPLAAGDIKEAAVQEVASNLAVRNNPVKEAVRQLQAGFYTTAEEIEEGAKGTIHQDLANKIGESIRAVAGKTLDRLAELQKVDRVTKALASEKVLRGIANNIKEVYSGLSNQIMQISPVKVNPITTDLFNEIYIGKPGNELWPRYETAKNAAEKVYGLKDAEIVPKGRGFLIKINKPLDETQDVIRSALLETKESQAPDSMLGGFLSFLDKWRTPEETLAYEQRLARKAATYTPSEMLKLARDSVSEIKDLAKFTLPGTKRRDTWKDWARMVDSARSRRDKEGNMGYFFKTIGELSQAYQTDFKRLPAQQEIEAYFSFVKNVEMDRVLRNVNLHKLMNRVGTQDHSFWGMKDGVKNQSPFFHGVLHSKLPGGTDTFMVVKNDGTYELIRGNQWSQFGGTERREQIQQAVERGESKVVELWDPERRELSPFNMQDGELAAARVRYVIAENVESKDLPFDLIPRRGGGHYDMDYSHYLKQPIMRGETIKGVFTRWYEGDRTIMPFNILAMGRDVMKHMNHVRQLIKEGKEEEARVYNDQNLHIDWKEHRGWYEDSRDPQGKLIPARLSKDDAFKLVAKDKMVIDVDNELKEKYASTFQDGTRAGSLARQYQVQYTGERDAYEIYTMVDKGTRGNPLYSYEPAKLIDPIPTLNRALSRIINTTWMDDYKIQAIEKWLQRAKPYLALDSVDQISYAPFHYFHNADNPKAFLRDPTNKDIINNLMAEWHNINQFTGKLSETDANLHRMSQILVDSIYGKFGPKMVPLWLLGNEKDPIRFVRSAVFNMKMGLFSIPQLFVHAMTIANVWGIAGPVNGAKGTAASMLHLYSRLNRNPEILDHLDKIATKMGWRPGEWKEALEHLDKTGFMNEAGQYALKDDIYDYKIIGSAGHRFLEWGQSPFRAGVKSLRANSWYVAFKEFRDLHPTGAIGNSERAQILERADILSHNMTRASSSMLHKGVLSLPMQFQTYFLRLAEMFWGKRLTVMEKTRLLGVNAILFGVPAGLGVSGAPVEEYLRKSMHDAGYVVGGDFVSSLVNEGLPSMIGALISGKGDYKEGTFLNFGGRYGPRGMENIGNFIDRDKTAMDMFGGATASTIANIWSESSGLRMFLYGKLTGQGDKFPLRADDLMAPFRESAAINSAVRSWQALNTHRWLSTKGQYVKDTSLGQVLTRAITGLYSQEEADIYTMGLNRKDELAHQRKALDDFTREFHMGIQDDKNNDKEQAAERFRRAEAYLIWNGYPEEKIQEAYHLALQSADQDLLTRMKWYYYTKGVPEPRKKTIEDTGALKKTLQRGDK